METLLAGRERRTCPRRGSRRCHPDDGDLRLGLHADTLREQRVHAHGDLRSGDDVLPIAEERAVAAAGSIAVRAELVLAVLELLVLTCGPGSPCSRRRCTSRRSTRCSAGSSRHPPSRTGAHSLSQFASHVAAHGAASRAPEHSASRVGGALCEQLWGGGDIETAITLPLHCSVQVSVQPASAERVHSVLADLHELRGAQFHARSELAAACGALARDAHFAVRQASKRMLPHSGTPAFAGRAAVRQDGDARQPEQHGSSAPGALSSSTAAKCDHLPGNHCEERHLPAHVCGARDALWDVDTRARGTHVETWRHRNAC